MNADEKYAAREAERESKWAAETTTTPTTMSTTADIVKWDAETTTMPTAASTTVDIATGLPTSDDPNEGEPVAEDDTDTDADTPAPSESKIDSKYLDAMLVARDMLESTATHIEDGEPVSKLHYHQQSLWWWLG